MQLRTDPCIHINCASGWRLQSVDVQAHLTLDFAAQMQLLYVQVQDKVYTSCNHPGTYRPDTIQLPTQQQAALLAPALELEISWQPTCRSLTPRKIVHAKLSRCVMHCSQLLFPVPTRWTESAR